MKFTDAFIRRPVLAMVVSLLIVLLVAGTGTLACSWLLRRRLARRGLSSGEA